MDHHEGGDLALQVGIELEELGRDFYEALAAVAAEPGVIRLCKSLAAAELQHEQVFRALRAELATQGRTILVAETQLSEAREQLKQTAIPDRRRMLEAVQSGGIVPLLRGAAEMERNSIKYYQGLRADIEDRDMLSRVIEEELGHLHSLERLADRYAGATPSRP